MSSKEADREVKSTSYKDVPRGAHGHWLPGQSANPAGRAKGGQSITHALLRKLEKEPTLADKLADKLIEHFEAGNAVALKQVWDRLDGTVTERSETLVKQAEASEMSREAILIAAEAIKRQDAEKEAATLPVEGGLPSEGTADTQTGG